MKDKHGLYFYPRIEEKKLRMYVREHEGHIQFRLWNQDYPLIWKKHPWTDHEAILKAHALYKEQGKTTDPLLMYDLNVAKRLIEDDKRGL